jgi:hypothetical protein
MIEAIASYFLGALSIYFLAGKKKPVISCEIHGFLFGAGYRIRTGYLMITSQLLYQVS